MESAGTLCVVMSLDHRVDDGMRTYDVSLSNASAPKEMLHPRATSWPVSRSLIDRPTEYDPLRVRDSSDKRSTSILSLVSSCQNAGCTTDARGANWTTGMVVEARDGTRLEKVIIVY